MPFFTTLIRGLLPVLLASLCFRTAAQQVNLEGLLSDLTDLSRLPRYADATYCAQESSYDRSGMNDDGFNGRYSFLRRNPDSSLVIFDQKGPGVINRIWTPTPTDDTLHFYIDQEERPSFSVCYRDLYSGNVYPFVSPLCANQLGGYYCYLPIPFARSCKIVLAGKFTRFHQIGYQLFASNAVVKSFSLPLNDREKNALAKVREIWNRASTNVEQILAGGSANRRVHVERRLQPGATTVLFETPAGGRINGFSIAASAPLDSIGKLIDLKISWDNEPQPAVFVPLADYFGYAFGKPSMQGLISGFDGRQHYSWFPMPFDRSARVELVYRKANAGQPAISINASFFVEGRKRDAAHEGKFYALWNRENPATDGKPFTFLDVKGRGHLAGVVLQAQGLKPGITQFFEGDDSTVIDGQLRFHGTGSEDFFNGGWYALLDCWDDAMSLPLSGSLEYSIPLSRTGGYRYFLSDKLFFNRSLLHTIEHGPEFNRWPSDYTSVSFYYCDRPNRRSLDPSNANTALYLPDTLELYPQLLFNAMDEHLSITAKWDGTPAKGMYYTVGSNTLLKFSLQDIPTGKYSVLADFQRNDKGVKFSTWQRQTQLSGWIDTYDAQLSKAMLQPVCDLTLTRLNNSMTFRFKTMDTRDRFILNRLVLIRKKEWK